MDSTNVDFAFLITDDDEEPVVEQIDLTSSLEDDLLDDDVDIYEDVSLVLLANDQEDVLDYEELSDLSGDEFLEEPAAPIEVDSSPQELNFSEEDLLEADYGELASAIPSTRPSYHRQLAVAAATDIPPSSPMSATSTEEVEMESTTWQGHETSSTTAEVPSVDEAAVVQGGQPTSCAAAEDETAAVQGCDPAIMHVSQKQLDEWVAELPFPPLEATLRRWRERTASPSMMDYIRRRRRDVAANGHSKFFIPYNLRDVLNAKKERELAQGPRINRRLIIEEYRLKKEREAWDLLDQQHGHNK